MLERFSLAILVIAAAGSAGAQAWEAAPTLPTGGAGKVSTVGVNLAGTLYALGGTPWTSGGDGSVYSYTPGTIGWVQQLSFDGIGPVLGQGGGIDSLGRILIFGGEDTDNPGDSGPTFDWNPSEGPWHQYAMRSPAAPIRGFAYCTDSSRRIYSLGGGPGESASALNPNSTRVERYLAGSDTWEVLAPMPVAAGGAAAVDDGLGHILVIGGVSASGTTRLAEVQQFDIATGTWSTTAVADLPVGVSEARAIAGTDGKIYLVGGRDGPIGVGRTRSEMLVLNPATGVWTSGPSMSVPRRDFGIALASDGYIYAIGGANDTGSTNTVERIHPTACPVFNAHPQNVTQWQGSTVALHTEVVGDGAISIRWQRDGVDLNDGPTGLGSTIAGVHTTSLRIISAQVADSASYRVVATNDCGTTISLGALIEIEATPALAGNWTVINLHPNFADRSVAYAVEGDVQVGVATFDTPEYSAIDHPMIWRGSAVSGLNVTPAGSQGGAINAISGNALVGWWWRPIQCYVGHQWVTCYFQRACKWDLNGNHSYPTATGWEYHSMADTDGSWHVGSVTNDDGVGNYYTHAYVWREPNFSPLDLHPSGASKSGLTAIDGIHQYGWIHTLYPGPVPHAAMWSGTPDSFVDLHPAGTQRSGIDGAADGQQVGTINWYTDRQAVMWSGSLGSFVNLHPVGAGVSSASACAQGLQVGTMDNDAVIWSGNAESAFNIGALAGTVYATTAAYGIDVALDGTISVVGSGFNQATGRQEALLWRLRASCGAADFAEPFGTLDFFDVAQFLALFSAQHPNADMNADGAWDFFDVSAFLSSFSSGCP